MADARLTANLVRVILIAAVVTAPIFLFGEGFEAKYIARVAASNGLCVLLCLVLLRLLKTGQESLAALLLVFGLLALVGGLAWFNGEPVHVNVINFVLVAVLASAAADRRVLVIAALLSTIEMVAIAWDRPLMKAGHGLAEARFESIVQFLPTYLVVVAILWLRACSSSR
jgi:hypothetical protein